MKKRVEIPVKLNKVYEVKIDDITGTGEGIAKINNFTIFVDKTVPGDLVKIKINQIKKNYATGKVIKILRESNKRTLNQFCPYENICGGCPYSQIKYSEQLKIKEKTVKDALERIGGFKNLNILPIISSKDKDYRNKAQFKVNQNGLGFYQKSTHNIINFENCQIQQQSIDNIISDLNKIIKDSNLSIYNEKNGNGLLRGILIRSNSKDELIVTFIINGDKLPNENKIINKLKKNKKIIGIYLNINKQKGNRILGPKTIPLFKEKDLIESLGEKKFIISPNSFFQVNSIQAQKLYEIVKEFTDIKENDNLLDLYCGTGSIGIFVSQENTKLTGIEIIKDAIEDAIKNAELNNLTNSNFYVGKVEEIVPNLNEKPTCIILDPPRKGCEKALLEYILNLDVPRIVYVSCNPATLARDLKILSSKYCIKKVQPVDMFPQSGHIETVVLLEENINNAISTEKTSY